MAEGFYFDNDIVVDANGVTGYGLRSYASISFSFGEPVVEIFDHLNDTKGDYFDPLLSLVLSIIPGDTPTYSARLYYCHNFGSDYVELADYGDLFIEQYELVRASVDKSGIGPDSNIDLKPLIALYNSGSIFLDDKVRGLRSK